MSATGMLVQSDLRRRWRSWVVLGLLAAVTMGVGAAGVAGARRSASAVPRFVHAWGRIDAAILANDPRFDARAQAQVAQLPEMKATYPFEVAFAITTVKPSPALGSYLLPTTPQAVRAFNGVLVNGRQPNPARADEAIIDQNAARRFHLGIGSPIVVSQSVSKSDLASLPPALRPKRTTGLSFTDQLHVVGIAKSVSSDPSLTLGSGFYRLHQDQIAGFVNEFVELRHGEADVPRLQQDVNRIMGFPVNVERGSDILGTRKAHDETVVEADGLLLFALAALVVGGVLVGQALVRSVTAGAADLPTWRALGADRRINIAALALPATVAAAVAGVTTIVVAIVLSSRFPIGVGRRYDLDVGTHVDWLVLAIAAVGVFLATLLIAFVAATFRALRPARRRHGGSRVGALATNAGLSPALVIGSRLASEPGEGRTAVPVRSALIGAIVGVLGVSACMTFRDGISDAVKRPERSGVVWNYAFGSGDGLLPPQAIAPYVNDRDVAGAINAGWYRALPVNGTPTPTFGITTIKGHIPLVILAGRAPQRANEIVFAPTTMRALHLHVGDVAQVGDHPKPMRVVGEALLPATSHTDYDQSGWMTAPGLRAAATTSGPDDYEDYVFLSFRKGADVRAAGKRIAALAARDGFDAEPATLPTTVIDLGRLRALPLALAVFFGFLAIATVAHALVTTVRRRHHDLAILRSLGFTRRESRVAIAWQSTVLALAGLLIGIPIGIVTGRLVWRWLAHSFPLAYVPPFALLALALTIPITVAVANLLAAGPAHAATRISPAQALRTE